MEVQGYTIQGLWLWPFNTTSPEFETINCFKYAACLAYHVFTACYVYTTTPTPASDNNESSSGRHPDPNLQYRNPKTPHPKLPNSQSLTKSPKPGQIVQGNLDPGSVPVSETFRFFLGTDRKKLAIATRCITFFNWW